jgi:anti-sigma factor RsiW
VTAHSHGTDHCRVLAERLSEHLDGELPPDLRRQVEEQLAGCVTCGRFVESVRRVRELAHLLPSPELPPDRLREIAAQVKGQLGI